ncbi:hypothetical protein [Aquabacterium sp.]|uniref:hypothetical protein n=1 Tax=Aquabacterium sp. TaxID=1872578 RepID=UPI0024883D35|nr:hypothetical protein [Aquabacterium sp.]MDI1258921.1 hypothetical protein [Aquabacterium sp.]
MRGLFSLLGLLAVLVIIGLLAKHQLGAKAAHPADSASSYAASDAMNGKAPQVDTPAQARQLEKQVQDDVNKLMQSRPADIDQPIEPKP